MIAFLVFVALVGAVLFFAAANIIGRRFTLLDPLQVCWRFRSGRHSPALRCSGPDTLRLAGQ